MDISFATYMHWQQYTVLSITYKINLRKIEDRIKTFFYVLILKADPSNLRQKAIQQLAGVRQLLLISQSFYQKKQYHAEYPFGPAAYF